MGLLELFTSKIAKAEEKKDHALTYRVVLGALLSLVSGADGKITEEEVAAKKKILGQKGFDDAAQQEDILDAAGKAITERLDWQGFTREVNKVCVYEERVKLVHDLFSVAWADHELESSELETIRKIADLLWLDHKDFINAKLATKPEALKE
ncbi:TerB family tellurite resistance protein [bacterium]|nr:TerB family tellurite resistance protein [bacterium]